jgi:hypothetical protein
MKNIPEEQKGNKDFILTGMEFLLYLGQQTLS